MLAAIRKTKDGYEATYERILPHPPEKVWRAVSDGEHIASWFTRNDLDPEAGGRYVVHHDHVGLSAEEEVLRYDPPRLFEHTWGKGEWGGPGHDTVCWEVHPHDEGTRLVLTFRFRDLTNAPGSLAGWHIWLDVLETVLSGRPREEHEPPHGTFEDGRFTITAEGKGVWARNPAMMDAYARHLNEQVPAEA